MGIERGCESVRHPAVGPSVLSMLLRAAAAVAVVDHFGEFETAPAAALVAHHGTTTTTRQQQQQQKPFLLPGPQSRRDAARANCHRAVARPAETTSSRSVTPALYCNDSHPTVDQIATTTRVDLRGRLVGWLADDV